jgi:hypothetical protein
VIKYALKCQHDHVFDVWFNKGSDFDDQRKRGLVECPSCGSKKIEKAPMAPSVKRSKSAVGPNSLHDIAEKIRGEIESNCDNVGTDFAEEARAMHYGEKPERGIYGSATRDQAKDLVDEGVKVVPLPGPIAPRPKKKLN